MTWPAHDDLADRWRCDVPPSGDEGAESVVPQPVAVFGVDDPPQFQGGESFASGVEFPGGLGYGAGAEAAIVAEAGDAAAQRGQRPCGGWSDYLCDLTGNGGLLDADPE